MNMNYNLQEGLDCVREIYKTIREGRPQFSKRIAFNLSILKMEMLYLKLLPSNQLIN